jgi:hypothetical protein
MIEGFVPVATYSSQIDAELAQATLASAGIDAYLQYEDTGGMLPVLQQSEGVKLLVDPSNLEEARTILESTQSESPEATT